jgi:N-methyl-L-proline demethylase
MQELARLDVTVRLGTYAEADELAAGRWDVIIVATGGLPASPEFPGAQHVVDSWDILSRAKRATGRVLVFDDHGGNQALDVTEVILRNSSRSGAAPTTVELVTLERTVSPDVGGIVASGYIIAVAEAGVRVTVLRRIRGVHRADDGSGALVATLGVDGSDWTEDRVVDTVVVEAGTRPVSDVYDDLRPGARNGGQIDLADLLARRPQATVRNPDGTYQLFRIGDAVAGRNVHAAMLDAARLCRSI